GSHIVPTQGSYSVAMLVRHRVAQAGFVEWISQGQSSGPGFYLGHDPSRKIRASDSWGATNGSAAAADGLVPHYALGVDSVAIKSWLYVDGAAVYSFAARITTPSGGTNTRLGNQFAGFNEFHDGDIDEVQIYSGPLNAAAIATLAAPAATKRLVYVTQP